MDEVNKLKNELTREQKTSIHLANKFAQVELDLAKMKARLEIVSSGFKEQQEKIKEFEESAAEK